MAMRSTPPVTSIKTAPALADQASLRHDGRTTTVIRAAAKITAAMALCNFSV